MRTSKLRPIPAAISNILDWLDPMERMSEREYRLEAKKAVRKAINSGRVRWDDIGMIESYDERVWELVEEVLSEN